MTPTTDRGLPHQLDDAPVACPFGKAIYRIMPSESILKHWYLSLKAFALQGPFRRVSPQAN